MDKSYWDRYYQEGSAPGYPSPFAEAMVERIDRRRALVDLGAGNGRDSLFFSRKGIRVVACDQSAEAMTSLALAARLESLPLDCHKGDFTRLAGDEAFEALLSGEEGVGTVYSRFSFHTVEKEAAIRTMEWAARILVSGGIFLLEARSEKDDLFGVGERVSEQAYVTDHYRRFLRLEEVLGWVEGEGLEVESSVESKGLAVFGEEDPIVIRVVARA